MFSNAKHHKTSLNLFYINTPMRKYISILFIFILIQFILLGRNKIIAHYGFSVIYITYKSIITIFMT